MHPATEKLAPVDEANLVLDHAGQVNVFLVACLLAPGGFLGRGGSPDIPRYGRSSASGSRRCRRSAKEQSRRVAGIAGRISPDVEHHIRLIEAVDGLAGLREDAAS